MENINEEQEGTRFEQYTKYVNEVVKKHKFPFAFYAETLAAKKEYVLKQLSEIDKNQRFVFPIVKDECGKIKMIFEQPKGKWGAFIMHPLCIIEILEGYKTSAVINYKLTNQPASGYALILGYNENEYDEQVEKEFKNFIYENGIFIELESFLFHMWYENNQINS